MHWSQIAFGLALFAACYSGRRDRRIVAVMIANFAGTLAFNASPLSVAIVDLASVAVLAFGTIRARVVAAFFVAMAAIYPIAYAAGLDRATIYTIVDVLAFLQLVAVARGDDGIDACRRYLAGLRHSSRFSVVDRIATARSASVVSSHRRGRE
jgi:hypothetical protein